MECKQRVLIVHNYYKLPGGEDTVVENEKKLLEEHGHTVILYSRTNKEMEHFSVLQKLLLPLASLFSLRTYYDVKQLIRENKIDIVHVHNTLSLISPSVYYAAFVCRKPVIQNSTQLSIALSGSHIFEERKYLRGMCKQRLKIRSSLWMLSRFKNAVVDECRHFEAASNFGNL